MRFLRSKRFRRWSWFAIVALVLVALVRNGVDDGPARTDEERVRAIASTMKCPVCAGQSVADSDVAAARAIRTEIARRVEGGQSDDEIRDAIAATYGEDLQLTPSASGFAGLVWILPVVALVFALAGLSATFARWRRSTSATATDADRVLVEHALSETTGEP
jgi:cytochrome c-type biogenesis protein CcmH